MRRTNFSISLRKHLYLPLALLAPIVAFDALAYVWLPERFARSFADYRAPIQSKSPESVPSGVGQYPRNYFEANADRGFDIAPGAKGTHRVDGKEYPIWANALGCFDREHDPFPDRYIYFGGDSFTWGYVRPAARFTSRFQDLSGLTALNCGVTHTGQLHQFSKFNEIVARVRVLPERVVVGYFANDIANDFGHPHSTVLDGWLVDEVFLDASLQQVRVDRDWLRNRLRAVVAERRREVERREARWILTKVAEHWSISLNVIRTLAGKAANALSGNPESAADNLTRTHWRRITELYSFDGSRLPFAESEKARRNREAIEAWITDASEFAYDLVFFLIPPRAQHTNADYYADLADFLTVRGIRVINLAAEFARLRVSAEEVYWVDDPHLSERGHEIAAQLLARELVH